MSLQLELTMVAARRVQPAGWLTEESSNFAREAGRQAGYCIDAPEEMPAGCMYWVPVDEDGFVNQLMCTREAEA